MASNKTAGTSYQDSLFFHKHEYDEVIIRSTRIARALGVVLRHEHVFAKKIKESPCCQPWNLILVDWDGDVFPCIGGEVTFYAKVKSGEYHFANLLNENLVDFWVAQTYTKLRRGCLSSFAENHFSECTNCPNLLFLKGPNVKESHLLK